MPPKKKTEEGYRIKQFKNSDSDWWANYLHYHLYPDGVLVVAAGGLETPESREAMTAYLKRKKIQFKS